MVTSSIVSAITASYHDADGDTDYEGLGFSGQEATRSDLVRSESGQEEVADGPVDQGARVIAVLEVDRRLDLLRRPEQALPDAPELTGPALGSTRLGDRGGLRAGGLARSVARLVVVIRGQRVGDRHRI